MCGQVIYPAAVLKAAPNAEAAREFLAYLQTDRAATVFEDVGLPQCKVSLTVSKSLSLWERCHRR